MTDDAKVIVWNPMKPDEIYEADDLSKEPGEERDDLLLDEMLDPGREEWNTFSYFVVTHHGERPVFVSPDFPAAEAYAKGVQIEHLRTRSGKVPQCTKVFEVNLQMFFF